MKLRDRIKSLRRVKGSDILPNPRNWRTHPEAQANAMRGMLAEIGIADALLVRETPDGLQLIDGHLRADVAPETRWPCLVLDVDEAEADSLLATVDPLSAMAGIDAGKLDELLHDVELGNEGLEQFVAGLVEQAGIAVSDNGYDEDDDLPDPPAEPVTKIGDVWSLGNHRLVCGDAADSEVHRALLGRRSAQMCFTDPPYNVDYTGKTSRRLKLKNDKLRKADFATLLSGVFSRAFADLDAGAAVFVFHPDTDGLVVRQAFAAAGFKLRQCLVWVKDTIVLGRQDYHWRHEPILYGSKPGARHRFFGDRKNSTVLESDSLVSITADEDGVLITMTAGDRSTVIRVPSYEVLFDGFDDRETVWRFNKPRRSDLHPTTKPVAIPARAITHCSKRGEIVLDPFCGSGSTLVACERLGRRAFCIEIDPAYCDVIIERWQAIAGKKAKLLSS